MNAIKIIILLVGVLVTMGIFIGLICLQVHISKNDKRGKFVIPIVLFLLPIISVIMLLLPAGVMYNRAAEVETYSYVETDEDDNVIAETYVEEESIPGKALPILIAPFYGAFLFGWPTAITTLIIELVYRSKRNKVTDEDVIDIQNL